MRSKGTNFNFLQGFLYIWCIYCWDGLDFFGFPEIACWKDFIYSRTRIPRGFGAKDMQCEITMLRIYNGKLQCEGYDRHDRDGDTIHVRVKFYWVYKKNFAFYSLLQKWSLEHENGH